MQGAKSNNNENKGEGAGSKFAYKMGGKVKKKKVYNSYGYACDLGGHTFRFTIFACLSFSSVVIGFL